MCKVRKNKLTYQIMFVKDDKVAQSEMDTVVLTDHDSLMVGNSLFEQIREDIERKRAEAP